VLEGGAKSLLGGKIGAVLMPRERSQDIDDMLDFAIVDALLDMKGL
jgi:CMP-N-acetylneuraminic acid synthetase